MSRKYITITAEDIESTSSIPIERKVDLLNQLCIWGKMSKKEQEEFINCTNEYHADRLMRDLRSKYLM